MTISNSDPKYISYNKYDKVIYQYDKYKNLDKDNEIFGKSIKDIDTKWKELKLSEEIFNKLHKILRNSMVFYGDLKDGYCSYVNYWLNKEVKDTYHNVNETNFDIFDKFVINFNIAKHSKKENTCYGYIKYLDDDIYRRMTILYNFYTFYNNLKSSNFTVNKEACDKLLPNVAIYNDAINDFYNNDRDLFKKFREVKDLVVEYTSNPTLTCKKYANFHLAKGEQAEREQAKREAALERERVEREKAEREKAQMEAALKSVQEQYRESPRGIQPMQKTIEHLRVGLSQEDDRMGGGLEDLRASIDLPGHERSHVINYPKGPHLGPLADFRGQPLSEQDEGQFEGVVSQSESEGTPKDSSFLSSLGIPRSITGVLGEIDPVPVVGVSGGMGALFLLFRYTPFGTFFRGGRGRAHRIPRSFNGQFLGGFQGYEDYDVGHIGYGPMNPLAE